MSKFTVSTKNEFTFPFDIDLEDGNNLDRPEPDQFKIVLKKINTSLNADRWSYFDKNGHYVTDIKLKLEDHFVRFENPITLYNEDNKQEFPISLKILLSDKYQALNGLVYQAVDFMNEIDAEDDVKKDRIKKK